MKNIKLLKFFTISILSTALFATDYDNAKFDNYVSGQGVNEVLAEAQYIICAVSKMGTKELSGDGTYKATIYADECEAAAATSTDSSQGTSAPTSATTSSSSSASATGASGNTQRDIDTVIVNTGFTTTTTQTTKGWMVNEKPYNDQTNREPKNIRYILINQTAPVSDTNKFGDFNLKYQSSTYNNTEDDLPEWYTCPSPASPDYQYSWCADGADLGRGLLIASGGSIAFKRDTQGSPQQNVVANYLDNGDIAGVYSRDTGFMDESLRDDTCDLTSVNADGSWNHDAWWACQPEAFRNSNVQILGIFAFGISNSAKTYCTKMTELYQVDWNNYDEERDGPTLIPYTLSESAKSYLGNSNDWDTEEKCYSIDKADATRNIWDYGVYNADGSNYSATNQSFPIRTTVEVNETTRRVHGYASYWGVWVEDEYRPYINESTEWVRDDDTSETETQAKYKLKVRNLEIDKREKSFLALNELDGVGFRFWVNDSYWSDEYQKLGFPKVEPWEGKIQFKTSKATFTDYNNGDSSDPLTYGIYGTYDGVNTYVANLDGAKIDKDNLRKIIQNDSSDPGKPMNLTMKFSEFPVDGTNPWYTDRWIRIYLCNTPFIAPTNPDVYSFDHIIDANGPLTSGLCMRVEGELEFTSDGTKLVLASDPTNNYHATFRDMESQTEIHFDHNNWNNSGYSYDFEITLDGVQRPTGMEIKLQSLMSAFGGISQLDNDGGDIQRGLESFLDSSNSFTYIIAGGPNLYDHEGNRFSRVMGTFGVDSTPPATVFVDDIKEMEPECSIADPTNCESGDVSFNFSLSKAQATDVTVDYAISASSTAAAEDYTGLSNGTVTIAAGATTATVAFNLAQDDIAEGQDDEKIIITLSNPTNAILGRTTAIAYIYDRDTNRVVYDDYYGTYDAETLTFTITEGLKYNPNYVREDLPAPITFTTAEWVANMYKTWGAGEDWEFTDYRELNTYSDDTNQDYTISKEAMENPTSSTSAAGVSTTKWSRVTADELPSSLHCIQECLTATGLNTHYSDAKAQADPAGDNTYTGTVSTSSPSPYADVGPYIKANTSVTRTYDAGTEYEWSETLQYNRGDWNDGIVASDVYTYSVAAGVLTDASSAELKDGVVWGVSRPSEMIRGSNFVNPQGNWTRETYWGINTGMLVDTDSLQYLECDYELDSSNNKVYTDYHPEYTSANGKLTETRYCVNKMWGNDNILVSYNVNLRLEKDYDIFNAGDGSKVALSPPKTLYFRAPNDKAKFGDDADKKFRLDYHGDHLGGIPGNVINIETGEVLGEYVEQWQDDYRWVQRFVIPDGSKLTDSTGTEFLVKALAGEEWLGKKDSAIGSLSTLLTAYTASDLLTNKDVDFEISQRTDIWYECSLTKEYTNTYTDGDGNTQTDTYTDTDWDACHALEWGSAEWAEVWSVSQTFNNCDERIQYEKDQRDAQIAQNKAETEANGGTYEGPASWAEDENFLANFQADMDRCQSIGPLPTSIINNGNASVVSGTVVYNPTP